MPSLSLLSLNHLHLPKCLRSLLNGDDLEFCGGNDDRRFANDDDDDDDDDGDRRHRRPPPPPPLSPPPTASPLDDRGVCAFGSTIVQIVKTPNSILGLTVVGGVDKV